MNDNMNFKRSISKYILVLLVLVPTIVSAQTANELVAKLEKIYTGSAGVEITCSAEGAKPITMILASQNGNYKLVANGETFVSNGTTVWHSIPTQKKVLIDNAKKSGSISANQLLDFSHNYDANLTLASKGNYFLKLTPLTIVAPTYKSFGEISAIMFAISINKEKLTIKSITALNTNKDLSLGKIKIKQLKKLSAKTFEYTAPKGYTVMDLRD